MALVVVVPAARGHPVVLHALVGAGRGLVLGAQALHELQAQPLLLVQDSGAPVGPVVDEVGLGAREPGAHDHLGPAQEDGEAQVVAVETETPGLPPGVRLAEDAEVVRELVHDGGGPDQGAQKVVHAHGGDGLGVALGAEGGLEHRQDVGPQRRRELVQPHPFVRQQELRVRPRPPLR